MDFIVEDLVTTNQETSPQKPNLKRKNPKSQARKAKQSKNEPTLSVSSSNDFKISNAELYKPPTVEELNQLRETEILFNSNLFRLQTEELLKEISFKEKRIKLINTWIEKFKEFVQKIPKTNLKLSELGCVNETITKTKLNKKLSKFIPLDIKTDQDCTFTFTKPISIETTGLFNVGAISKPNFEITLTAVIPKTCFNERDYMNYRYLVKRSIYLGILASNLEESQLISELNYNYNNGNPLTPILQLKTNEIKDTIFNIRVVPEENVFKLTKFLPEKSNLRTAYLNMMFNNEDDIAEEIATPFYNATCGSDLVLLENDKFCSKILKGLKGACEGLILLKVWLNQRGFLKGYGGFNEDILLAFIVYLTKKGKINKHMSSYQVIRNFWTHLSTSSWDTTAISLCDSPYDLEIFHKHYDVVFIDTSGKYNITSNLDKNIYLKVKNEAKLALNFLDEAKFNSFQSLFITKMPNYLQYDAIIHVKNEEALLKIYENINVAKKSEYINFAYPLIISEIISNLKVGLSDRINFITPLLNFDTKWKIGEKTQETLNRPIEIGLNLNYFNLFKVIEKGPPTYEPEAKTFRDFWGDRSELRRFKDGSITEAVYWPATTIQEKRKIFKEIVDYVLEKKLNLTNFKVLSNQFDSVLKISPQIGLEEANLKIINTFDELGKILRNLKLQLGISSVQGISESFCYSDAFPPLQSNYIGGKKITFNTETNIMLKENHNFGMVPKYVKPIEGILQMALHSKWPNDYKALSNLKTAFYIEISKHLSKEGIKSNPKPDYLDILFNGLVFRFSIFHQKQLIELKKIVDESGVVSYEENDESVFQEQKYVVLPKIIGALNGIHAQFPSFGSSTVLIKRWLNSQLIDDFHFPNAVISLLNASIYLNSAPFEEPALPQVAFLRFLHLLANYDWNLQPVIINFNNEITREQLDEHESYFHRNRSQFSPLHIITPFDDFKSILTKNAPTTVILNRLKILSTECINIIEKNINEQFLFESKLFFTPNLDGYNIIIHLKPLLNPRRYQDVNLNNNEKLKITNDYEKRDDEKIPVIDFNPVDLYLKELRSNYNDFALFFHDSYGGNIITVIWKPIIHECDDFKINQIAGRLLTNDSKTKVNTDAIIEDFYILGEGLVRTIETR